MFTSRLFHARTFLVHKSRTIQQDSFSTVKRHIHSKAQIKCVTLDVTGTIAYFKGDIGDYYCNAARETGLHSPDNSELHEAFKVAYDECDTKYPCFGHHKNITTKDWWFMCVKETFERSGHSYTKEEFDLIFESIYRCFGSTEPYGAFEDSKPFMDWCKAKGLKIGIISNGTERYQNEILPKLGLDSNVDFWILSKVQGVQKPDPRIFVQAKELANDGIEFENILHIGDSFRKDLVPARAMGMHTVLLDRFNLLNSNVVPPGYKSSNVKSNLVEVQKWMENTFS